jgi:hypothetical protein
VVAGLGLRLVQLLPQGREALLAGGAAGGERGDVGL